MEKKNIDWGSIGFGYIPTDYRYVANFKDGKWDEGEQKTDISLLSVLTSTQSVLQTPQEDWKCQYSRRIVL